ncbi:MAG: hypothetical protein KGL95_11050 [Patescibacteria group bacterium]|nr:hypothetical protein [Patescibacteria group bacterium]
MGDKCATTPTSIIQPGQCDCSVGPFNYKTCCDSNGNQKDAYCRPANDGTGNTDGDCYGGDITVRCNDPRYNNDPGAPSCGQAACDTLAPPQTIQGTITDNQGNKLNNVSVVINDSTKGTQTTVSTGNNNSGFFSNNNLVRRGNSFTVSPNKSAGSSPCNAGMICGNGWNPNSPNPYTAGNGGGCSNNNNTWTCNFTYTQGYVSGTVYVDYNHDGVFNYNDVVAGTSIFPSGITITDTTSGKTDTTDSNGNYQIIPLNQGSHTIQITVPSGYQIVGNSSQTASIGPNATTVNFFITPMYTISGIICNDPGIDGSCLQSEDSILAGSNTLTVTPLSTGGTSVGTITQAAYQAGVQVVSGTYSVSYSASNGYYFTASKVPGKSLPPYSISVGQSTYVDGNGYKFTCTAPAAGTTDASCSSNNIINMNFAVSNLASWYQGWCTDMRLEAPAMDVTVPNTGSCTDSGSGVSTSNAYAIVCLNNNPGTGVYYSGPNSPTFGYNNGQASSPNYLVGGTTYPESFTPVSGVNRASYTYLYNTISATGTKTNDITPYCGGGGTGACNIDPTTPDGVYLINGNLTLDSGTPGVPVKIPDQPNNKSYVFLISGTLTINSDVQVPTDTSVVFASKGDIYVAGSVGVSTYSDPTPNIEGFYSTEGDFWILSNNKTGYPCGAGGTPLDERLNISGGVIVGGTLQNQRELCKYDAQCPVTTYSTNYDYLLYAPAFVKHKDQLWQEQAPSGGSN